MDYIIKRKIERVSVISHHLPHLYSTTFLSGSDLFPDPTGSRRGGSDLFPPMEIRKWKKQKSRHPRNQAAGNRPVPIPDVPMSR